MTKLSKEGEAIGRSCLQLVVPRSWRKRSRKQLACRLVAWALGVKLRLSLPLKIPAIGLSAAREQGSIPKLVTLLARNTMMKNFEWKAAKKRGYEDTSSLMPKAKKKNIPYQNIHLYLSASISLFKFDSYNRKANFNLLP
jgi:hypothetical protein